MEPLDSGDLFGGLYTIPQLDFERHQAVQRVSGMRRNTFLFLAFNVYLHD